MISQNAYFSFEIIDLISEQIDLKNGIRDSLNIFFCSHKKSLEWSLILFRETRVDPEN